MKSHRDTLFKDVLLLKPIPCFPVKSRGIQPHMRTTLMDIYTRLSERYGPMHWWPAETPFEVCVGAILTQNTNWGNVEKAIANLKAGELLTAEAIHLLTVEELADLIRPSGFFNVKSVRLKGFVDWLYERFDGELPRMFAGDWRELRTELLKVKGIGRETCDSILLYAGGKPTFVVDAYTMRLLRHLGLIGEGADYETVRSLFMDNLPEESALFNEYHALIVRHCKEFCRKRPVCPGCPLTAPCLSAE